MNENIMRCHYRALTSSQTYRKSMHQHWKEIYPETEMTEQRICDQKRQIEIHAENAKNNRGNWLTKLEIKSIQQSRDQEKAYNTDQQVSDINIDAHEQEQLEQ